MPQEDESEVNEEIGAARAAIARTRDQLAKIRSKIHRDPTWRSRGEELARWVMADSERMRTVCSNNPGIIEVHELTSEYSALIDEARELIE